MLNTSIILASSEREETLWGLLSKNQNYSKYYERKVTEAQTQ